MSTLRTKNGLARLSFSKKNSGGFTLVEMIVSLGLFTIIMFIATSAFLSIVNADRKSRAVRIAADNLNIALEDMSRRIKTGSGYYCGDPYIPNATLDCPTGGGVISFIDQGGTITTYKLANGAIMRTIWPAQAIQATSPEINITNLKFIVSGSLPCGGTTPCTVSAGVSDAKQPMVVILVSGSLGAGAASSTFKIQTTVTQRAYDN